MTYISDPMFLQKGWYGVDLDGCLAEYHGETAFEIGKPIPRMVKLVKKMLAEGKRVKIMTARCDNGKIALAMGDSKGKDYSNTQKVKEVILAFCRENFGQELEITNQKDYGMIELYDDRAITVENNTGKILTKTKGFEKLTPECAAMEYLSCYAKLIETKDEDEDDDLRDEMDTLWYMFHYDATLDGIVKDTMTFLSGRKSDKKRQET